MKGYIIRGGQLVTEEGILRKDIVTEGGRIVAICDPCRDTPPDREVIQADGCYVSAGFIDIHQHGGGGADYMDAQADTYRMATEAHLRHGITSVMPTLLSADREALLRAIESYKQATYDPTIRANLLGIHIEGPYISPKQAGAQKPCHIRPYNEEEYRAIAKAADGHIKRWSTAPEVEGVEAFAAFAKEQGITLSMAHTDADYDTVVRAFALGFRHVTHLYSCMSTITRKGGFRVAGALEAAFAIDDMNVEIIADGCHLPTQLLSYVTKFKAPEHIALITDAMRAAGADVTESFLGSAEDPLPVIVEDGVAKLTDRTAFAGSVATGDRLVRTMLACGTPLCDAVAMATVHPLRMMGLSVKKGKLAVGYDADVCIFDRDVQMKHVLCGSRLVL
ncbi:MAG: N-acetylglucosamine-6-phosphate deacetylase [Clostridia bacterium]|nr:N-acetylglucosamine-6-phosphate deacetylase [Clostridia bacterium]